MKYGYIFNTQAEQIHTPADGKFGVEQSPRLQGATTTNLGDYIQSLGIIELYRYMGIPERDIIPIDRNSIATYDGEPVVLPLNFYFIVHLINSFPPSPNIIPVFWGFAADQVYYCEHNDPIDMFLDYFKLFHPIGCRDTATCEILRSRGVDSYISGCSSFFFPHRQTQSGDKILLIDVMPDCYEALPQAVKDQAHTYSHVIPIALNTRANMYQVALTTLNLVQQRLSFYAMEAQLVVTNRLHVAVPCVAMGIPVVLAKTHMNHYNCETEQKTLMDDWRYGWFSSILRPCPPEELATLNWDSPAPPLVDIEAYKWEMMEQAQKAVEMAVQRYDSGEFNTLRPQILENTLTLFGAYVNTHYRHSEHNLASILTMEAVHSAVVRERDEAQVRLEQKQQETAEIVMRLGKLEVQLHELGCSKTELQVLFEAQLGELSYSKSELDCTKTQLRNLLCSKSWRYTAPCRKILAQLKPHNK